MSIDPSCVVSHHANLSRLNVLLLTQEIFRARRFYPKFTFNHWHLHQLLRVKILKKTEQINLRTGEQPEMNHDVD